MSSLWFTRSVCLLSCAAVLAACRGQGPGARVTIRDSADIRIAENELPDSARVTWWRLDAEPELEVGKLEGAESETLFEVSGALRLSDGRVAIANSGTSEVRYHAPDGRHLITAGRRGGGPGEFQRITKLVLLPGDSLAVVDPQSRRLSVLDPTGAFAREVVSSADVALNVIGRRPDGA